MQGENCEDCGKFVTEIFLLNRGRIKICEECSKDIKYRKYRVRRSLKYMQNDSMTLLPPAPGSCRECAREHEPHLPHDKNSLYYQVKFYEEKGRYPTWADALSHCDEDMKTRWRESMLRTREHTEKVRGEKLPDSMFE